MLKLNEQISFTNYISSLDIIIFILVLLATLVMVIYGQRYKKNLNGKNNEEKENASILELLIMGRQLTLPLFVGTLVATWYGGILGVTQIAFENGIYNFITQGFFWYLTYLLFAFFLVNKISSYKSVTLPDLIEKQFGPKSSKIAAVFNLFNVVPIAYILSLGIFMQTIFGGELLSNMIFGLGFVFIYSLFGGFRAVVFSDFIQFIVMCVSVFLVILFSYKNFGGLEFLKNNLDASYFNPLGNNSLGTTLVWGFIALSTLVDPNFYQRVFAAKSSKVAKNGILISTCIWICFDFCTTFGAMYAKALIPNADSSSAYIIYFMQILPDGVKGFVLAGLLATILSTLDSYLFLASTTLTFDLFPKLRNRLNLNLHLGILFIGSFAILLALVFKGNIKLIWKTLGSYSSACLLTPVLLGQFFKNKISDNLFFYSCIISLIGVTFWRNFPKSGFAAQVDELYIGILLSMLSIFLGILVSQRKTIN